MATEQQGTIVSTEGDRHLRIERTFDAPRERVFATYMDPELIPQWWGPRGTTTVVEEMEPRTGGSWRYRSEDCDGNAVVFRGVYREVTAPERLASTFEWDGMPGYVSVDESSFEDLGDGRTRIVTLSTFHTPEERDGMVASGMEKGLGETYDRFEELLRAQAA